MAKRGRKPAGGDIGTESDDSGNAGPIVTSDDGAGSGDNPHTASGDSGTVDPSTIKSDSNDGNSSQPRKRGRPPGSTNRPRATQGTAVDLSGLEKLLFGIHMVGSHLIAPEIGMSRDDCRELGKAISDVNRHYNIRLLDQKQADWFNLIQLAAVAYGTRFMAIRERKKNERRVPPPPRTQAGQPVSGNPAPPPAPDRLDLTGTGFNGASDAIAKTVLSTGEIPGVGAIQFPQDHDLFPRRAN